MAKHNIRIESMDEYPIRRKKGYLYYVDGEGYVHYSPMKATMKKEEGVLNETQHRI